jgi:bifunctional ADP-heptose synthase (sugar kinase/adenylyltransferase)
MTPQRLKDLLDAFRTRRIAVVGDFFLDKYLEVDPQLAEPSLETGRTAHQVVEIRKSPGAAGTVVNNLAALETGTLHTLGVVGEDGEGFDLRRGLEQLGCLTGGLLRSAEVYTPTYLKPRDIGVPGLAGEHSRYDTKNRRPLPESIAERLTANLHALLGELDAVVIMDQVEMENCGVVSATFRAVLNEMAARNPQLIFWADSRRFIREYRRMIIKPNQFEAVGRANPLPGEEVPLSELQSAVRRLREETERPVFVTCGEKGMFVSDPELTLIPGVKVPGPLDPTGAGDSATAGAVLTLASGGTPAEAALVGNLVASITVQQLGTTGTASPRQVLERFELWRRQHEQAHGG